MKYYSGRRISGQSTGELVSQHNPDVPVIKQGHWTQQTDSELDRQDNVELLRVKFYLLSSVTYPRFGDTSKSPAGRARRVQDFWTRLIKIVRPGPDKIEILDPDPDPTGSGSTRRRCRITTFRDM